MAKYSELRKAVDTVTAVDAHAHNLVAIDSDFSFLHCFSEAQDEALTFVPHTLSFKRNVRDIAKLFNCEASFDAVDRHRKSTGIISVASRCFDAANISTIFIDDGIKFDKMHDLEWHRRFGPVVGRILRIEHLAETILNDERYHESNWTLELFSQIFMGQMTSYPLLFYDTVVDKIVAMKSIAAYRSGLKIDTNVSKILAEEGLLRDLHDRKPVRIKSKGFIDYIFTLSLEVAQSFNLPMQIHTGFGDKDLDLRQCNPLHLRTVLEERRFSRSRIVLLHAAYPYSREASYLASVYPQRSREVLFHVLSNACEDGDLTIDEALEAVEDIFRQNALRLYNLSAIVGSTDYKSYSIQKSTLKIDTLLEDIMFVRIIWADSSGQQRCRVIPVKRFYEVVANTGVGLTFASMGMTSFADGPADGTNLTGTGEIRLMPDCSTKHRIPWSKKEEMVLADMQIKPGEAWEYCPRSALRRLAKILNDEFNLVLNAGFENEFYLLKNIMREGNEHFVPFDLTSYCSTSGFDAVSPILQEVNAALQVLDITVEQVYFLYFLDDIGSGSHVHLSLWKNGRNVFMGSEESKTPYGMSEIGEKFMAGVFYHLPSILAFTAPLPNSYDRIQPNTWSGAYQCWGKENREAPLRTACPPGISQEVVSNFEIKSFDGCANPHLGLASIIAAGIDGLKRNLSLPKPIEVNPSSHDSVLKRLPKGLHESIQALAEDNVLKDLLGQKLITAVIGVRKAEIDYYGKNKEAYKQLIHKY
ncbi:hypothetical protein KFK09_024194 [Dendrobium nobile]|uniref:GS catalytic domain-containing protein n=1 Tax=Dendrobium nobile TaxID=94219 RepID=A0A8T3ADD3_DENNO|nr:hypothetical protein KFK09_024194 [Dendrobium nobile]